MHISMVNFDIEHPRLVLSVLSGLNQSSSFTFEGHFSQIRREPNFDQTLQSRELNIRIYNTNVHIAVPNQVS